MRQRLSPGDTTAVTVLCRTRADGEPPSGVAAARRGGCETAMSCRFAVCNGDWEDWRVGADLTPSSSTEWFVPTVSGTLNGTSARYWSAPGLDSSSASATATRCLDIACLPSGCCDLNVSSQSPAGSRGGTMTNCPDLSA